MNTYITGAATPDGSVYKKFDLNNNGRINVADMWYLFGRKSGRFTSWGTNVYNVRYYSVADFTSIKGSSTNVNTTYPGVTSMTINTPTSGGSTNFYLIAPGYSGSVGY